MYPITYKSIEAMKSLIRYFLRRQEIVAIAMLDIHPGPLQLAGTHILGIEIAPYLQLWQERNQENLHWQQGIWHKKWKHYAHGHGCRLTHLETKEIIEWDAPDLEAFDENWFWQHLIWRIEQTAPSTRRNAYETWLREVYNLMLANQLFIENEYGKLKLKPESDGSRSVTC